MPIYGHQLMCFHFVKWKKVSVRKINIKMKKLKKLLKYQIKNEVLLTQDSFYPTLTLQSFTHSSSPLHYIHLSAFWERLLNALSLINWDSEAVIRVCFCMLWGQLSKYIDSSSFSLCDICHPCAAISEIFETVLNIFLSPAPRNLFFLFHFLKVIPIFINQPNKSSHKKMNVLTAI